MPVKRLATKNGFIILWDPQWFLKNGVNISTLQTFRLSIKKVREITTTDLMDLNLPGANFDFDSMNTKNCVAFTESFDSSFETTIQNPNSADWNRLVLVGINRVNGRLK